MDREKVQERKDIMYAVKISFQNIDDCYIYNPVDFKGENVVFFELHEKEKAFNFLKTHLENYYKSYGAIKNSKFDRTVKYEKAYVDYKNQLTINQIAEAVHNLAKEKGWHDENESIDHFIERTCNNIHNEVSELHEAWRNNNLYLPCDKAGQMKELNLKPLTCLEEEMADIIIRALDACMKLKLDPQDIIARKHIFNTTRPHRHGGKRS